MVSVGCWALVSKVSIRCEITCTLCVKWLMAASKSCISVGCAAVDIWVLCAEGARRESSVELEKDEEAVVDWEEVELS